MKNWKKLTAFLAAVCLTFGSAALVAACSDEESSSDPSSQSSESVSGGDNDSSSVEAVKETLTVSVKDKDGNALSGVEIAVKKGNTAVTTLTTGADGLASADIEVGVYTLQLNTETLPTLFIPDQSSKTVTFVEDCTVEFIVEDTNPTGEMDNPFACYSDENGEFSDTIPANTNYYYIAYRMIGRKITIENEGLEVTFNGQTYTAQSGKIEVPLGAEITDMREGVLFSIRNVTGAEIEYTMTFEDINVIEETPLTLGEEISNTLTGTEEVVTYVWTATADGVLKIASTSENRQIAINVNNVTEVFDESDADGYFEVTVSAGAKVTISVAATDISSTEQATIVFTATFTESVSE